MQNVFGTQRTWILGFVNARYASFSHGKSCQSCLCSAVPLAMGQLSCYLGRERESSPVEVYFKLFFWAFMEVFFWVFISNLMPRKASTMGKACSTPVQPDLAHISAALGPNCKRRSISLVEMLANKFHRNKQLDEFWPELK